MSEDLRLSSLLLLLLLLLQVVVQGSGSVVLRNHINIPFSITAISIAILLSAVTIVSRSDTMVPPVVDVSSIIRMIVSTIIVVVVVTVDAGIVVEIGPADSAHAASLVVHGLMVLLFLTTCASSVNGYDLNLLSIHCGITVVVDI
jgi:hypothetical protein